MELIDKDALLAEMEKEIKRIYAGREYVGISLNEENIVRGIQKAEDIVETIGVKDVDFENEFNNFLDNIEGVPRMWHSDEQIEWGKDIARHFFELGLNTQQNIDIDITNIDKVIEENGIDPNSKEAKMFKESYYMALEKFKAQKGK